jgi:hypothetical protein
MRIRHFHRRLLTWTLTVCVLFAQSAALAYACQRGQADGAAAGVTVAPCPQHLLDAEPATPIANGNVCEAHCQTASLPDAGMPDLPAPVAIAAWLLPPLVERVAPAVPSDDVEAKSAAPPPLARSAKLLI